ncbi:ComF family protein [Candidatus Cardinium hertigii]|nr:ComF family protein [Candidatus Cardinium hertigii]
MFYRVIEDVAIADAFALYWLRKKSLLERVLVAMKYKNQPNIGLFLGRYYATMLAQTSLIQTIEGIVPIPLHRRRLQERGYNQSGFFAQGLAEVLQIPCYSACVERIRYTPSQTKKSKEERKANLQGVFRVMHPELIQGKHLLLVDDIFTTGATLVSCAKEVLAEGAGPVSMATIAIVEA